MKTIHGQAEMMCFKNFLCIESVERGLQIWVPLMFLLMIGNIISLPLQAQSSSTSITPILPLLLFDEGEPVEIVEIAAASSHSCARLVDGSVKCWGDNNSGRLGDGTTIDRLTPVLVR